MSSSNPNSAAKPSARLATSSISTSSLLSPNGDIASLGSLQDGTTSSVADATQEVVKDSNTRCEAEPIPTPAIHYAKITTRRAIKETGRRKINLDFTVANSNQLNKFTFSTTPKLWEWRRDIERDRADGLITEQAWNWYQEIIKDYELLKSQYENRITIGKGNLRGNSRSVKYTACIFTGDEVRLYLGNWVGTFELQPIMSGAAARHHDMMAEFRNNRTGYQDFSWS